MAALTHEQKLVRNQLIEAAQRRNPRADFAAVVREATAQTRRMLGLAEAGAVDTATNRLNAVPPGTNPMDDTDGNSFEAFLAQMIEMVSRDAAATGKVNPAYAQLATQLAMAQARSMSGVQRSSFVSPAAGSTPVGRTESARVAKALSEALAYADLSLAIQRNASAAPAAAPAAKALADMTPQELQSQLMARFGVLADEGALKSPYFRSAA